MEKIAQKINEEIKKSYVYQEYLRLNKLIESDDDLISIKKEMSALKGKICKGRDEQLLQEYYELEKQYKNNIMVKEYLRSKEELNDLLKDVVDILSVK